MRPAQKAPENWTAMISPCDPRSGFNEAGAKSAGKQIGRLFRIRPRAGASMRPAQKAPENLNALGTAGSPYGGFNEAGAKSAGKPRSARWRPRASSSFNEAGAKSAGKPETAAEALAAIEEASMRPAQKAPENSETTGFASVPPVRLQ